MISPLRALEVQPRPGVLKRLNDRWVKEHEGATEFQELLGAHGRIKAFKRTASSTLNTRTYIEGLTLRRNHSLSG